MELIRSLVAESGDPVLQLAISIGEESGARISEVCNLRLPDVDQEKQELFVRLPKKTNTERYAPFHNRTKAALASWLEIRPSVSHDYLLTGTNDIPLRKNTRHMAVLRMLSARVLMVEKSLNLATEGGLPPRRLLRHPSRPHPRHLPQLLHPFHPLAVLRPPPRPGRNPLRLNGIASCPRPAVPLVILPVPFRPAPVVSSLQLPRESFALFAASFAQHSKIQSRYRSGTP
jgi:Phage integrase family